MSRARMQDLQTALQKEGWEISNRDDVFSVEDEVVTWRLYHPAHRVTLDLEFHLFGDLGQRNEDLDDISYCLIHGSDVKLYFKKRNTNEWKQGVTEFVQALGRIRATQL